MALAIREPIKEDDAHMEVLSNIEKLNREAINPSSDDLLKRVRIVRSHLDLIVSDLFKKGYIDSESNVRDYHITNVGRSILERYRTKVKYFVSSILQLCRNDEKDRLYRDLTRNRGLLRFAYYEGFLKKTDMQMLSKKVDVGIPMLWLDNSIQKWGEWTGEPPIT